MVPNSLASMPPPLVPGRACGACNVCCVSLTIDDVDLQKVQGYRCRHAMPDNGCDIYEARPDTCRTFFCGWRQLKWVKEGLRPDTSQVLVRLHQATKGSADERRVTVVFCLLSRAGLKAEGLAESVAAAVNAGVDVYLEVPGPPGYTSGMAQINDAVMASVMTRDKPGLLAVLRKAWQMGRAGENKPIRLAPRPSPAP
jgi:hypothetical protein